MLRSFSYTCKLVLPSSRWQQGSRNDCDHVQDQGRFADVVSKEHDARPQTSTDDYTYKEVDQLLRETAGDQKPSFV